MRRVKKVDKSASFDFFGRSLGQVSRTTSKRRDLPTGSLIRCREAVQRIIDMGRLVFEEKKSRKKTNFWQLLSSFTTYSHASTLEDYKNALLRCIRTANFYWKRIDTFQGKWNKWKTSSFLLYFGQFLAKLCSQFYRLTFSQKNTL